jgi:hypothetical protein
MNDTVPFAARRDAIVSRAVAILSADARFPAGWLEGSLADGSADPYSDIDLHLAVVDAAWDEVWPARLAVVERIAPVLASLDVPGVFGTGCLIEGPMKLDVFFERQSTLAMHTRIAVKRLWGAPEIFAALKLGDDLGDGAIARMLEYNVLGLLQGAAWPVRILARGQLNTFLYCEILLVETAIVPLLLLEKDRRAFHRNMFTRAKLLAPDQAAECSRLINRIVTAVDRRDHPALRDLHIEIFRRICGLARIAFARYALKFPPRVEDEMVAFYAREWPV